MTDIVGMRRATEKGSAQAKDVIARMSAATEGPADLMRNVMQTTQDYNAKVLEFATANWNATLEYLSKLAGTKTPSEFVELITRQVREQSEILTQQARELTEVTRKLFPTFDQIKGFS